LALLSDLTGVVPRQKLGQPIQERHLEAEERPKAFDDLGKQIQLYMKAVDAYKTKVCKPYFGFYYTTRCERDWPLPAVSKL